MNTDWPRSSLPSVLVAIVVGIASCVLTTLLIAPRPRLPAPSTPCAEVERKLVQLTETVARLESRLQDAPPTPPLPREPVAEEDAPSLRILERLDRLERRLSQHTVLAGAPPGESVPRSTSADWQRLGTLQSRLEHDRDQAQVSVTLLTAREVVERFGLPSVVAEDDGRLQLLYEQRGPTGNVLRHVGFWLANGHVFHVDSLTR